MTPRQPRYDKEEYARRGTDVYERRVRPLVEGQHPNQIVAIDIESGEYELAGDSLTAAEQLLVRLPDAQIWCVRIGHCAVHTFGSRVARAN